ncbi:MAG: maleylacetoacetate isomerase [Gammaproteobacteria bacterium]
MILYDYFRSTAAYRVRMALNYKGIEYQSVPVHLVNEGGEQFKSSFLQLNPQAKVPVLVVDEHTVLAQSLAIIEYLEEYQPQPALLPRDAIGRARVRQIAQLIACDIHPLNNIRVLNYLTADMQLTQTKKTQWYHHWVADGFHALEQILTQSTATGRFCHGDEVTLADICLVAQLYNAYRFECPLDDYPTVVAIGERCLAMEIFKSAHPDQQLTP